MATDPTDSEILSALRPVVTALESMNVPYLVCGSVASSVYGEPRATRDVDVVADLSREHASSFVSRLSEEFYADGASISDAIGRRGSFNVIHLPTMIKVDIFVAKPTPFARSQLARRQPETFGHPDSLELQIASPEDTVLAKLDWYRKGSGISDQQWRDILGVLKVQAEMLDRGYLQNWAAELDLADLLSQALDDAGLV